MPPSAASPPSITAVLFDMGGVIVELGPLDELLGVAMPAEVFWPRWLASESVRRFERGASSVEAFGAGLCEEFQLDASPSEVIERFRAFPRGLYPGAAELVAAVADGVATGVLSNTNRLHWEGQRDAARIQGLFDHRFLSYELGLVKPDAELFHRVAAELDCHPSEILFLDDNRLNVEGARAVGIDAHLAAGVHQARAVLMARGLLRVE